MHCFIVFPFFLSTGWMENIWLIVDPLRQNPQQYFFTYGVNLDSRMLEKSCKLLTNMSQVYKKISTEYNYSVIVLYSVLTVLVIGDSNYRYTLQCMYTTTYIILSIQTKELYNATEISQSLSAHRTTKQHQTTVHFHLNMTNNIYICWCTRPTVWHFVLWTQKCLVHTSTT